MSLHDLIFSNRRRNRILRHFCFWMGWIIFSGIVQLNYPANEWGILHHLPSVALYQFIRTVSRLPIVVLFTYGTVYFFLPRLSRDKNIAQLTWSFIAFLVLLYVLNFAWFYTWANLIHANPFMKNGWSFYVISFNSFYSNINFTGAVPTCCLVIAIKYYKIWYLKQQVTEQLNRENKQAQLQLLKAQVHPHFLFNTLNNIYSFVLTEDPRASTLVDKLSGLIDYMRKQEEHSLVPVEKEIRLIKDYVGLERVRYGERLDLQVSVDGDYEGKYMAPLLMIPFVENCFKHGASIMLGQQWIHLVIKIEGNQLDFHLANSKPANPRSQKNRRSIGLINVRKRLELLYPAHHSLEISSTDDAYNVHLVLTLQEEVTEKIQHWSSTKTVAYA